jgi:hypothetical protein
MVDRELLKDQLEHLLKTLDKETDESIIDCLADMAVEHVYGWGDGMPEFENHERTLDDTYEKPR